ASPDNFLMEGLTGSVKTNTYLLLIAGVIMVITLYFSRKARSVTKTEIYLSRQGEGYERFGSTGFARVIVRQALEINETINKFIPRPIRNKVNKRFEPNIEKIEPNAKKDDKAYFDLVRASVNLTVASILISFATSLKLPLSTTYVTFMVAMGTSLSDRAWGRESAVYRITGVFTVIGGWFLTALIAFTAAFVVANIITHGGPIGIIIVLIIAVAFLIRTHSIHKKREGKVKEFEDIAAEDIEGDNIMKKCSNEINNMLETVINIFNETIIGVSEEDRKRLRNINKKVEQLNYDAKTIKNNVHHTLVKLEEDEIETGHYYVQVTDYLREMAHALSFIAGPSYDHVANQHRGLTKEQIDELKEIKKEMTLLFTNTMHIIENNAFEEIKELVLDQQQKVLQTIDESRKNQIKRIKKKTSGTKNSILYLQLLNEMKNFTLHTGNLLKAQRDFITNQESN
ncbi:MAG: inorganic phosphate transporter, partial [Bacteroidales bacterium]